MDLSLLWWNTSLTPVRKDRDPNEARAVISSMMSTFCTELGIDLIALAEISSIEIETLRSSANLEGFELVNLASRLDRSAFDICVVYRNAKLQLSAKKQLVIQQGRRQLKLGQRLDFVLAGHARPLHIFLSHWPSRLWTAEDHVDRHLLGIRLRDAIDEILTNDPRASIILAGDYNDEPFDRSLSEHIKATRDRQLASRRSDLFYNPFWACLAYPRMDQDSPDPCAGSYFHSSGASTKWRTFDQFMFSSGLLGSGEWELDETRTLVLNIPAYTRLVLNTSHAFDHLPVVSAIRRKANG